MEQFVAGLIVGSAISFLIAVGHYITTINVTAIVAGQRWFIPGIGAITILKTLSDDLYFSEQGPGTNVCFAYENLNVGYASKRDIKKIGVLLPSHDDSDDLEEKDKEIEKVIKKSQTIKDDLSRQKNNIIYFIPKDKN